jgi:hypothetical protein
VTTPERPDPVKQPTRGALMPAVLTEVGSITLAAEHDLLLSPEGQAAAAEGIASGIASYFADRPLAVRYDALVPGGEAGRVASAVEGSGPPFWAADISPAEQTAAFPLRLTNTGTEPWPDDLRLMAGLAVSSEPYLREEPLAFLDLGITIPPLAPGESVVLLVEMGVPGSEREMLWISVATAAGPVTDLGSAPLQLAIEGP